MLTRIDMAKKSMKASPRKAVAFSLSFSHCSLNTLVKEDPSAPSANISLNKLGILLATKKASRELEAPKTPAITDSRSKPVNLLNKVPNANQKLDLKMFTIFP